MIFCICFRQSFFVIKMNGSPAHNTIPTMQWGQSLTNHIQFQKDFAATAGTTYTYVVLHTYMVALTTYDALSSVSSLLKVKLFQG